VAATTTATTATERVATEEAAITTVEAGGVIITRQVARIPTPTDEQSVIVPLHDDIYLAQCRSPLEMRTEDDDDEVLLLPPCLLPAACTTAASSFFPNVLSIFFSFTTARCQAQDRVCYLAWKVPPDRRLVGGYPCTSDSRAPTLHRCRWATCVYCFEYL
jgi:hypothetical protein